MERDDGGAPTGALERALVVLKLFTDAGRQSLGVTEISHETRLAKAVIHRILTTLCDADFVEVDPATRRYWLGPSSLKLGAAYLARQDIRRLARPSLEGLSRSAGETSALSIRREDTRYYIDQVLPSREVRMSIEFGTPYPLHAGASSKAFLAFLPEAEQEMYLRVHQLEAFTERTLTDESALREELSKIRKLGYAQSFGEQQQGSASIAAPVFDHEGRPVAVLSVCGPDARLRSKMTEAVRLLIDQTRYLSGRLGFP